MKLTEKFSKFGTSIKQLIKEYPITLVIIFITTLLIVIDIEGKGGLGDNTILKIITFAFIWAIGAFGVEVCFKNKISKIVSYIITGVISLAFVRVLYYYDNEIILYESLIRLLVCYITSILLFVMYKLIKKSELSFSDYMLKVFANLFITGIMYGVLALGVLLLTLIFITLILNRDSIELIFRSQILILGLFYIPSIIYSLTSVKEKEISNIIKNLLYVLLILITIAIGIMYVYIVKIIIQQEMPENFVYRIIARIFVFAFPVWSMASNYKEKNALVNKLTNILPIVFIPLVILEIYSIGVRIADYGLTPNRYICVALALLQFIAIILCIYKKQAKLNQIFIYSIVIIAVITISPFNMQYMSNLSQKSILEKYLKEDTAFSELDENIQEKVRGAYRYIQDLPDSDKYMPEYVKNNEQLKEKIGITVKYNVRKVHYSNTYEDISVNGYNTFRYISFSGSGYDIKANNGYKVDTAKIKEYVDLVLAQKKGYEENYVRNNTEIQINEDTKLVITYLWLSSYEENGEAENVSIQGYLLRK